MTEQTLIDLPYAPELPISDALRESITAELIDNLEHDVRFELIIQHLPVELSETPRLNEAHDSAFVVRIERDENGEWELKNARLNEMPQF